MNRNQKKMLYRILLALALFIAGFFLEGYVKIACYITAWLLTGYNTLRKAAQNIGHGQILDENFLMTVATIGAFVLGDWTEGAAVMIFFQIGELFEHCAVDRSRRSIAQLMDLRPDYAYVWRGDTVQEVDPEAVQVGDLLRVLPGERIPVDGVIEQGRAAIHTAAITGESVPQEAEPGDRVLSGCVNLSGVLQIRATSAFAHSTVARILELVESSAEKKAQYERLITKFAHVYTPVVVAAAILLALLPPIFWGEPVSTWLRRALMFLVMSCPCALVISVPLSFFGGMGAASKAGVIVKGGTVLEKLAKLETVVFDKTGTVTTGKFQVTQVEAYQITRQALLHLAACCEQFSAHPVAQAICAANQQPMLPVSEVEELPGYGIRARVEADLVLIGNEKLMRDHGIKTADAPTGGTLCHVARNGWYCGWILLTDEIKPAMQTLVPKLKKLDIRQVIMLTGDQSGSAERVAQITFMDDYHAQLLPQDKVTWMEKILAQKTPGRFAAFVGDGVNDAPVLSLADVGIAMGGVGSDAAVEASDLVILNDDPAKLPEVIRVARKTCSIAKQNIIFAIGVKALVMLLGAVGLASMWMAIFADVGVAIIAILNAMRTMR